MVEPPQPTLLDGSGRVCWHTKAADEQPPATSETGSFGGWGDDMAIDCRESGGELLADQALTPDLTDTARFGQRLAL
jgi:hypothetical protein